MSALLMLKCRPRPMRRCSGLSLSQRLSSCTPPSQPAPPHHSSSTRSSTHSSRGCMPLRCNSSKHSNIMHTHPTRSHHSRPTRIQRILIHILLRHPPLRQLSIHPPLPMLPALTPPSLTPVRMFL